MIRIYTYGTNAIYSKAENKNLKVEQRTFGKITIPRSTVNCFLLGAGTEREKKKEKKCLRVRVYDTRF